MVAKCLIRNYLTKPLDLSKRYGKGSWALITGANGGIGKEYCLQLAEKGFGIILVGNEGDGLVETEKEIRKFYPGVKTKVLVFDLAESLDHSVYQESLKKVQGLDISIIVNNAGGGIEKAYIDISLNDALHNARLNMAAPTLISHYFLPSLLSRRCHSWIINVSSQSQCFPGPYLGPYPGAKKFLSNFSYHLVDNYGHKVDIQDLMPGVVATRVNGYKTGFGVVSAEVWVRSSLRDLGQEFSTTPCVVHSLIGQFLHLSYHFLKPLYKAIVVTEVENTMLKRFYENTNKNREL